MGYTHFTVDLIEEQLTVNKIKSVCDLGAQNLYNQPELPAPYASEFYKAKGIEYNCIDLNGENEAIPYDLTKPLVVGKAVAFDLVVDAGTSEHCGRTKDDLYQVLKNIHNLCRFQGIIIRENPKTGNWPGHGFHYMTKSFYKAFCKEQGYQLLKVGEHAACGNEIDGWNVFAVMRKTDDKPFMSKAKFNKLEYHNS